MKQEQTRNGGRTGWPEKSTTRREQKDRRVKGRAFDVFTYKVDVVSRWSRQWEATMAT